MQLISSTCCRVSCNCLSLVPVDALMLFFVQGCFVLRWNFISSALLRSDFLLYCNLQGRAPAVLPARTYVAEKPAFATGQTSAGKGHLTYSHVSDQNSAKLITSYIHINTSLLLNCTCRASTEYMCITPFPIRTINGHILYQNNQIKHPQSYQKQERQKRDR